MPVEGITRRTCSPINPAAIVSVTPSNGCVTAHGGARELVLPGETGWLCTPGDGAALAEALRAALSLSGIGRHQLAARARTHVVENFTLRAMRRRTLEVYRRLLEK